jgi:hypothetical protein
MKLFRLLPILFLLSDACVERLELPVSATEPLLVVDGLLTNKPGIHSVKLFNAASLESKLSEGKPITNATVNIVDEQGNSFPMHHAVNGLYSINDFQGEVGKRYKLQFSTAEGRVYESTLQQLNPPGEITELKYELVENAIDLDDLAAEHDVFRFYVDSKNTAGTPGLFRWRWTAIYEALTRPELRMKLIPGTNPPSYETDPMPCSGFVSIMGGTSIEQIAPCECCTCWVTTYSKNPMVSNNQVATRPEFNNVQVAQVPIDWKKFQAKYYIKVEQLNLSDEVYEFWKNVQSQQEGTGSIFQPNVVRVKGNIQCISDPNEEVAGVFSVAGSTERDVFIRRLDFKKALYPDTLINDCRNEYPGSTNVKPLFW